MQNYYTVTNWGYVMWVCLSRQHGATSGCGWGDEATGGWGKLHNEELHDLYSSPSIIRIIKWSRMRWAGHVARMGEKMNVYRLLVKSQRERDH
jgi:hypothetical protein